MYYIYFNGGKILIQTYTNKYNSHIKYTYTRKDRENSGKDITFKKLDCV